MNKRQVGGTAIDTKRGQEGREKKRKAQSGRGQATQQQPNPTRTERAPAGSRPPTCQTLIADQDRKGIEGLEPAGARSEPWCFWFLLDRLPPSRLRFWFGLLVPFLTAHPTLSSYRTNSRLSITYGCFPLAFFALVSSVVVFLTV